MAGGDFFVKASQEVRGGNLPSPKSVRQGRKRKMGGKRGHLFKPDILFVGKGT